MSDEDIKEKITSKKRDLSREEELERGKSGISLPRGIGLREQLNKLIKVDFYIKLH